jgi:hypothetical protein
MGITTFTSCLIEKPGNLRLYFRATVIIRFISFGSGVLAEIGTCMSCKTLKNVHNLAGSEIEVVQL